MATGNPVSVIQATEGCGTRRCGGEQPTKSPRAEGYAAAWNVRCTQPNGICMHQHVLPLDHWAQRPNTIPYLTVNFSTS